MRGESGATTLRVDAGGARVEVAIVRMKVLSDSGGQREGDGEEAVVE